MPARMSSSDSRSPDGPAPTTMTYDDYEYIHQYVGMSDRLTFSNAGFISPTAIVQTRFRQIYLKFAEIKKDVYASAGDLNSFHINTSWRRARSPTPHHNPPDPQFSAYGSNLFSTCRPARCRAVCSSLPQRGREQLYVGHAGQRPLVQPGLGSEDRRCRAVRELRKEQLCRTLACTVSMHEASPIRQIQPRFNHDTTDAQQDWISCSP